jgi:ribonuclease HII
MPYLIGIDEAGYAPNLGPLVVGGTLWKVPDPEIDLYHCLRKAVGRKTTPSKLAIADSKELHQPDSIRVLESNLWELCPQFRDRQELLLLPLLRETSPDLPLSSLVTPLAQGSFLWDSSEELPSLHQQLDGEPSLREQPLTLPLEASDDSSLCHRERFANCCKDQAIELMQVSTVPLFPAAYNELTERLGNKAHVLTALSLQLARHLLDSLPEDEAPVQIFCDKHGGRNRYALAIERYLSLVPPVHEIETAEQSRYRFPFRARTVQIQFAAGGESELPVALASMYAKYVREVCMEAFNRYWRCELPDLVPTKGYPADARRFREAIEPLVAKRGWAEHLWWRLR